MFKIAIRAILLLNFSSIFPQSNFNLDDYSEFLNSNQNLSTQQLMQMHPAGIFKDKVITNGDPLYQDSVNIKYELTNYEKQLLADHGFMVTERISSESFLKMFEDIFHKDLPLFISTDAILYSVHNSYDRILYEMEKYFLYDKLKNLLLKMHDNMDELETIYISDSLMKNCLQDVDLYLSVPLKLLIDETIPYYSENIPKLNQLLSYIESYQVQPVDIFGSEGRLIDFSQFKPRGHYEEIEWMKKYFKAMMWLGRIEIYLANPKAVLSEEDIFVLKRQIADAFLINKLLEISNAEDDYQKIEKTIVAIIGGQDNVTVNNLSFMEQAINLNSITDIWNDDKFFEFQDTLANQSFANQKILSHLLVSNPMSPDSIQPASAFLLFGQRFIIDSYILGSVVFDRIKWYGEKVLRMLPNTQDILFALGNDASAQLLESELDEYHYASNLAALRYLINNFDSEYWSQSVYLGWLNLIKKLNPPQNRENLPEFMQTAAWWQEKMNTQLSSWTELRHDNLLYAKQSYSGIPICSFPYIYVEPYPEFYSALKDYAIKSKTKFEELDNSGITVNNIVAEYFNNLSQFSDTMITITTKELNGEILTEEEMSFLSRFLFFENVNGCAPITRIDGWYTKLFYSFDFAISSLDLMKSDYLVADYHTAPADEMGSPVGWVAHSGTGPINLLVVNVELPGSGLITFCGPAYSYYEYTTVNFKRLTDTEWEDSYLDLAERPDWVNIYLADKNGESRGNGGSLLTEITDLENNELIPLYITASNYPNPFNNSTIIKFSIPGNYTGSLVQIKVFDNLGRLIKQLLEKELPGGNYLISWDGTDDYNKDVASGIYFYNIIVGGRSFTGKMNLIK